jgi:uncharacterized delta-60 repeat protein
MSAKTKVSGSWRDMVAPYVKVSGAWKLAKSSLIKIGGQWKTWFLQGGILDVPFSSNVANHGYDTSSVDIVDFGIQSDGKIVVCGFFVIPSANIEYFARLNLDGSIDSSFLGNYVPGAKILILPDDKIIVAGSFVRGIEKLSANGVEDASFTSNIGTGFTTNGFSNDFKALAVQEDGKILVCVESTSFNSTTINKFVRLNSNGTLDSLFQANIGTGPSVTAPSTINSIEALAVQEDGKIIIGGRFTAFNGTSANRIARLNSDGTFDSSFMTNIGSAFNSNVSSLSIQEDDKIIVGGSFNSFNGTSVNRLIRLNSNGTLDTSFSIPSGTFYTAPKSLILPNGQIFIYGSSSTSFNSLLTKGVARRNSDGTADNNFFANIGTGVGYTPGGEQILSAKLQKDGKIIFCGRMTSFNGVPSHFIARIGGGVAY